MTPAESQMVNAMQEAQNVNCKLVSSLMMIREAALEGNTRHVVEIVDATMRILNDG